MSHGQRLGSLLLTLGYLVLTLISLSRVRAVGLLLGMGYCLGILMAMYARGSDAALLMLFPCAITIGFRVWVVLPGMHVPFFQESVFFYLFRCARIYDAPLLWAAWPTSAAGMPCNLTGRSSWPGSWMPGSFLSLIHI